MNFLPDTLLSHLMETGACRGVKEQNIYLDNTPQKVGSWLEGNVNALYINIIYNISRREFLKRMLEVEKGGV